MDGLHLYVASYQLVASKVPITDLYPKWILQNLRAVSEWRLIT